MCWQKVCLRCLNDCGHSVPSGWRRYVRDFLFLCSMIPLRAVPYLVIATKNRVSLWLRPACYGSITGTSLCTVHC